MANGKVKVAVLDDYQGVLTRDKLSNVIDRIEVTAFPETLPPGSTDALIARLSPFEIVSTMRERTRFPAEVIKSLPRLKLLLTTGNRNAAIDVEACSQHGITVAGTKGTGNPSSLYAQEPTTNSLDSTMQHGWGLILALARNIAQDDFNVKHRGLWETGFTVGLTGKTLAVLGLGNLGLDTARIGIAFKMKVVAWSASLTQQVANEKAQKVGLPEGSIEVVSSKDDLFKRADVLSIHYVLSERSKGIVGSHELSLLKPSALLVNTSRAGLVKEDALLDCLKRGGIKGAAFDVFEIEPLPKDSVWRTTEWGVNGRSQVILSPHQGYNEEGSIHRWYEETAAHIEMWLDGKELPTKFN